MGKRARKSCLSSFEYGLMVALTGFMEFWLELFFGDIRYFGNNDFLNKGTFLDD